MPIPIGDYKNEPDSAISKIISILEQQPYQAYTLTDLTPGLSPEPDHGLCGIVVFPDHSNRFDQTGARQIQIHQWHDVLRIVKSCLKPLLHHLSKNNGLYLS